MKSYLTSTTYTLKLSYQRRFLCFCFYINEINLCLVWKTFSQLISSYTILSTNLNS